MPDHTEIEFHGAAEPAPASLVKGCPACGVRFSGDARFCPYDGEPLRELQGDKPKDPLIGKVIDGRYEVEDVLGEGGMGTVYKARHTVLERYFALKVLRADLAREHELGVRFTREAQAAAAVSHPNVVQINDFGVLPSGQPYFVMELLAGESLSAIVRKGGPLPAARAVRLLVQMVEALGQAHEAGVVHRDLKPDNVLVCSSSSGGEMVKVLDFGLAKVAGQSRLTKAGVVFGTPHYMSPEQAGGGTVDERTDIYALGVVMYEMFTGRVPFEADSYMGVLTKHLYVAPTPPSVILGGVDELGALEQVTLRCLEKKPEKRYATMSALLADLRRVASFTADGGLRVKPLELGDPKPQIGLADELELPTEAELSHAMKSAGLEGPKIPYTLVAGAVGLSVVGLLVVLLSRGSSTSPRTDSSAEISAGVPSASLGATPSASRRISTAPPAPSSVTPEPIQSAENAGTSTAESPQSASPAASSGTRKHGAGHVVRPKEPIRAVPPTRNSSTDKGKMIGDEVIDPWSR